MSENQREIFGKMTEEEKFEHLKKIRIIHPQFKQALNLIKDCHESSKISVDPKSLLIIGEPGAGKSTLFKYYAEKYDEVIHGVVKTKKRILWASVPSPASKKFVVESLLEQMGDFRYHSGTLNSKVRRLRLYIEGNGVELIMLDEFQHFLKPSQQSVYDTADWFKTLINYTQIPVVLFGLPESTIVLESNPQLGRRFRRRYSLERFGFGTEKEAKIFKSLLLEIDKNLPFLESSLLHSDDMCKRFFAASNGLMDTIISLCREAASFAIQEKADSISLKHLAWAFQLDAYANNGKENPFYELENV